ncbi:MAG: transporter substrate-binding domain-containing protein [Pseudomonadota bacterium]
MHRACRLVCRRICRLAAVTLLLSAPWAASAACSRPIMVPVTALGVVITVNGSSVGGIFPDLINSAGAKAGCEFKWLSVPRARLEAMFELGQADMILASTHTPKRDQFGFFTPMVSTRATLISMAGERAPIHSIAELLKRRELRVALVRGYDYGENYQGMIRALTEQNRIIFDATAAKVARLLMGGVADVTIMSPLAMSAATQDEPRLTSILDKLRLEPLDELPWGETGIYVSKSVPASDRAVLEQLIIHIAQSPMFWDQIKRHYPANIVAASMRTP